MVITSLRKRGRRFRVTQRRDDLSGPCNWVHWVIWIDIIQDIYLGDATGWAVVSPADANNPTVDEQIAGRLDADLVGLTT